MLKDKVMRYFLIISCLISFSSLACLPCDKDTSVIVVTQATPKFATSYGSSESFGQVKFKADLNINNELENINIISTTPSDVDHQVMLDMIKRSSYRLHTDKERHFPCLVKKYELALNFNVPQKVELKLDIDL